MHIVRIFIFFLTLISLSCTKQKNPESVVSETDFCSKYTDWPRTKKFDLACQKAIKIKDENFIFTGLNPDLTNNIFKIDELGNEIWSINLSKKYLLTESVYETTSGDLEFIFKLGEDSLFYTKVAKDGKLLQDITNIPLNVGEIRKVELVEEHKIIILFNDQYGQTNIQKLKMQPLTVEKSNKFWLSFIHNLTIKQNGDIIISGRNLNSELFCLDKDLNIKWEKTIENEKSRSIIIPTHIFIENNDEFINSNYSYFKQGDTVSSLKSRLTKYTSLGEALWTKEYGCTKFDLVPLDVQKYENKYFITGIALNREHGFQNVFLQCLKQNGEEIYMKIYERNSRETSNHTIFNNIFKTKDGMFLLVYRKGNHTSIAKVNEMGEN